MDAQNGFALFNAIAGAGRTIYELAQGASKFEEKQRLMEVYDSLMELKARVADLEDENRHLRERLTFKSEDFEFKNPLWYEKAHPDRALCPKCLSQGRVAPVGEEYDNRVGRFRNCLSCDTATRVGPSRHGSEGVRRKLRRS